MTHRNEIEASGVVVEHWYIADIFRGAITDGLVVRRSHCRD